MVAGGTICKETPVNIKHLTPFVVTAVLAVTAMSACGSDDTPTPGSGVVTTPTVGGADTTTPTASTWFASHRSPERGSGPHIVVGAAVAHRVGVTTLTLRQARRVGSSSGTRARRQRIASSSPRSSTSTSSTTERTMPRPRPPRRLSGAATVHCVGSFK